ncbi:MAG: alanine racemase [Sphingobium sp.]
MTSLPEFLSRVRPPMTPALVVRREALLRNLKTMQGYCDAAGVRLRPHGKMHKCSTLGRLQIELGGVGLCCQTIGEAEAYAAAGIADLLVTSPIAPWAAPRLAALAAREIGIAVVADDASQIDRLDEAARAADVTLSVLVDLDLGTHRAGCAPEAAPALAQRITDAGNLRFEGVQAYLGHLQHVTDLDRRRAANDIATARLRALVETLDAAGLHPRFVTGGGTGTYAQDLANGVFNELQAGSYTVMDIEYGDCDAPDGGGEWPFEPALFIAATAVSTRHKTHATIDAGLKAVAVDGPRPRVLAGAAPGSEWRAFGDEHGSIQHPAHKPVFAIPDRMEQCAAIEVIDNDDTVEWPVDAPQTGDLVWLQPGHCDPTINLYDALIVAEEDGQWESWPVDARRVTR